MNGAKSTAYDLRVGTYLHILMAAAVIIWAGLGNSLAAAGQQRSFSSPERAADALVQAARANQSGELMKIFGPEAEKLVSSGDPTADTHGRKLFVKAYDTLHKIERHGDTSATLVIGDHQWPFPIPIVKQGSQWTFDTKVGEQEIIDRRIGRNELNAIKVCQATVAAERDYALKDRNGDGILEYAQRFESSSGHRDGLYWSSETDQSPIGPALAKAAIEPGNKAPAPYHGYFYKIITAQGKNAPGGAYGYLARGHMIGGFAVVAFPAEYGASGVMTFIVNQDGVVYQKNLGPETTAEATQMTIFNPDSNWRKPQSTPAASEPSGHLTK